MLSQVTREIKNMIDPLRRRIAMTIGRGVLSSPVDDSTKFQTVQADFLADETLSDMERFQNYGFTGVPHNGSEAVAVFPSGLRDHGIIIAVDDRTFRLKGLEAGEVAVYTDEGDKIHFKRGNIIDIIAAETVNITCKNVNITTEEDIKIIASSKVVVDAPAIELSEGATEAVIKGTTFQGLFNAHTHNGNMGAPTGPPLAPLTGSELSTIVTTG